MHNADKFTQLRILGYFRPDDKINSQVLVVGEDTKGQLYTTTAVMMADGRYGMHASAPVFLIDLDKFTSSYVQVADERGEPVKPAAAPSLFKPGEVVLLKGGGMKMTVTKVAEKVTLVWHDDSGLLQQVKFPATVAAAILERFEADGPGFVQR